MFLTIVQVKINCFILLLDLKMFTAIILQFMLLCVYMTQLKTFIPYNHKSGRTITSQYSLIKGNTAPITTFIVRTLRTNEFNSKINV